MTQSERRIYLIEELLKENGQTGPISEDPQGQNDLEIYQNLLKGK